MSYSGGRRANRTRLAGTGTTPPRPLFVEHDLKSDKNRVGPHDQRTRDEKLALLPASPLWPRNKYRRGLDPGVRILAFTGRILDWLETHPGDGWQAGGTRPAPTGTRRSCTPASWATTSGTPSATA